MKFKALILAFILAGVTTSLAQSNDKEESAVIGLIKQMTEAQLKYDAPALDKLFTADYIEISPLGEYDPRDKVLSFYTREANPGDKFKADIDATINAFRRYGKFAVLIAEFTYNIVNDGKSMPSRKMRATFVCVKEKDVWKIASAQYTGIRPAAPVTPKTEVKKGF
jgi:uncharacterized protein (TIGR02246 family)